MGQLLIDRKRGGHGNLHTCTGKDIVQANHPGNYGLKMCVRANAVIAVLSTGLMSGDNEAIDQSLQHILALWRIDISPAFDLFDKAFFSSVSQCPYY